MPSGIGARGMAPNGEFLLNMTRGAISVSTSGLMDFRYGNVGVYGVLGLSIAAESPAPLPPRLVTGRFQAKSGR